MPHRKNEMNFEVGDTVVLIRRVKKNLPHVAIVIHVIGAWLEVVIPGESGTSWIPDDDVAKVEDWSDW
jgi:hypothetical protein